MMNTTKAKLKLEMNMVTNIHYDDDILIKLLRSRMGPNEGDVLTHVESCETCQSHLETLSQGGLTWDDVNELLTPVGTPLTGFTAHVHNDESEMSPNSNARFLGASEYPESLGRFARYEIMEVLGRGGMGIVMRGYDTSLNRHSAVKVLAPELATSAAARKRFSREAKSAAAVVHPHVVPIQTVDEYNGLPYLVMPVVEGQSVDARVQNSGHLEVIEAVRIAAQIAYGLAAAHEQGLVHRDIKPANILLENGVERVQITDFGLARAIDDASTTHSGVIAGTPQYMSPEQAHGDAIDHRSDLFSLGSLIYFMLTGRSPFRAETTMGVLNRIGNDQPRSIRSINTDVPEWLERIVTKLLEKQPDDRFQSATEVAELLDRWLAHLQQPALIPPPQPLSTRADPGKPQRTKWLVTATGIAFVIVALALFIMQQVGSEGASTPASAPSKTAGVDETNKKSNIVQESSVAGLPGLQSGQNVLWRSTLGSVAMRAPVVHDDHIYIGTNNGHGYLARLPSNVDLGVLLCFRKSDGKFVWQHSNEKLPTGRIHDWPHQGVTSRPCAEGDRLWYVTNRAEIVCLDTMGFRDGKNDGPIQDESNTDLNEADVVWRLDMMKELGVQPHNISTCTVALWNDRIFAVTGNGVGASHLPPLADAPSFIAVDKKTGKLLWQDDSPSQNVLHGQWGSPTVVDIKGKSQVVFPGGDGWLYSFDPQGTHDGKSKLIWKFDCNPKDSVWELGSGGTRNNLLHGPTLHNGLLYVSMGQDPEHGGGPGRIWCIDPMGTGDVSPQLVYNKDNPETPIPHRRKQACVAEDGDFTLPNPDSRAIWQSERQDVNGNGEFEIEEQISRSLSTIAIKDDLLFVSDIEGILHCLDRKTGKQHWGYDTLANVYSTPRIVGDHVYLGTEDGEVLVFGCSADANIAIPDGEPHQRIECNSSVNASVVVNDHDDVVYFTTQKELLAVSKSRFGEADIGADPYDVLYDLLMTRYAKDGKSYAENETSPVIFSYSDFPFDDRTYKKFNTALSEFAALPQEMIAAYGDVKRALPQRHHWKVFDATIAHSWRLRKVARRAAVQSKIASLIQRLALTREQILALPNTMAATVNSGGFGECHDPSNQFKPFLPADLYSEESSWVGLGETNHSIPASQHTDILISRSAFLQFMRLPGGRNETLNYIEKLNRKEVFPVGTQFALIEQAFLISDDCELILSPLIVSIQLRAYLDVDRDARRRVDGRIEPTQCVAEFVTQPRQLIKGNAVMKATAPVDYRFDTGQVDYGDFDLSDPFERGNMPTIIRLNLCVHCHGGAGGRSIRTTSFGVTRLFFEEGNPEAISKATSAQKQDDKSWKTLHELWRTD